MIRPSPSPPITPVTPDATLSFAVWLKKARRSLALRFLYCTRDLMKPKLWDVGEAGGFFHRYDSELETFEIQSQEKPASHLRRTTFFEERDLPLFRPKTFGNHLESYPVEGSQRIRTCGRCSGSGEVTCSRCGGSGRRTDSEGNRKRCSSCGGSGDQTCGRCSGEGKLLHYISKDYRWRHQVDEEYILLKNLARSNVIKLMEEVMEANAAIRIEQFDIEKVREKTGVANKRIRDTVLQAQHRCRELESEIQSRGKLLFQTVARKYVPVGYVNLHLAQKFGQFFVAGGKKFRSRARPPLRLCPWRTGFWLLSLIGLIAGIIRVFDPEMAPKPEILWSYTALTGAFLIAGIVSWTVDRMAEPPPLWMVMDDDGAAGWLYVHALMYAHANGGSARVLDPFFTFLLNANFYGDERQRNSFMCTVVERIQGNPKAKPRKLELIYINPRARRVFPELVSELVQSARRISLVGSDPSKVENRLSALQHGRQAAHSPELEKIVWADHGNAENQSERPGQEIAPGGYQLAAIYSESQWGKSSSLVEPDLRKLRERPLWLDQNRRDS